MNQLIIENFKYGLDSRREQLTAQPGTLVRCNNAHVNIGGEIEKRKAFVRAAIDFPAYCFGLEATEDGLVTFGSQAYDPAEIPVGVSYIRCRHPGVLGAGTEYQMTEVVFSANFNGQAFVAAKFEDGNTFFFLNGTIVSQSSSGLVLGGKTDLSDLATDFQNSVNTELANLGVFGWARSWNTPPGYVALMSPAGVYFSETTAIDTASGSLSTGTEATDYAGTAGEYANSGFSITTASGTFSVEAPAQSTSPTPTIALCTAVAAGADIEKTALAVALAINARTYLTGYTAQSSGPDVTVHAPASWGKTPTDSGFVLTVTGLTGPLTGIAGIGTSLWPYKFVYKEQTVLWSTRIVTDYIGVLVSGGVSPYTYECLEDSTGSANGIGITSPKIAYTQFYYDWKAGSNVSKVTGKFKFKVTDSNPTAPVTVYSPSFDVVFNLTIQKPL